MSGWICSYRKIWRSEFFRGNGMRVAVWHWLLHHAAWRDTQHTVGGVEITIKRGDVCFSQQQICDDTGATRKQVRAVIDYVCEAGSARKIGANERANDGANVRANAKTILVIEKYDNYQGEQSKGANDGASEGATEGPTKEQVNNNNKPTNVGSLSAKADDHAVIAEAVQAFKETAARQGWPTIRILSKSRNAALRARLRDAGGIKGWREALRKAEESDHCNGQNNRGWVCNFDFLTSQSGFTKLMEGNYDNRSIPTAPTRNAGRSSPHDSLVAGFAAYANSDGGSGETGFGCDGPADDTGGQELDRGQGGNASQPILRVIGSN